MWMWFSLCFIKNIFTCVSCFSFTKNLFFAACLNKAVGFFLYKHQFRQTMIVVGPNVLDLDKKKKKNPLTAQFNGAHNVCLNWPLELNGVLLVLNHDWMYVCRLKNSECIVDERNGRLTEVTLDRVALEMTPPPITMPPTTEASERDVEMERSSEVCVWSHVHITLPIMLWCCIIHMCSEAWTTLWQRQLHSPQQRV